MRPSALALLVAALLGNTAVKADPITQQYNYQVTGNVGTRAGVPVGNFDFEGAPYFTGNWGINGGQFTAPGSFALGEFLAKALPDGASLTYGKLPFYLQLNIAPVGTNAFLGGEIDIVGELNGTVSGSNHSTVVATIDSMTSSGPLPFPLSAFKIDAPQALSPNAGTLLNANITAQPTPIPEPSPLAILLLGFGALTVHQRIGRRAHTERE